MILKWKNLAFADCYLDGVGHAALLSTWGLDDVPVVGTGVSEIPDYPDVYEAEWVIWPDGFEPGERMDAQVAGFARDLSAKTAFVLTSVGQPPPAGQPRQAVNRIRCVGMWLLNDRGDTIERLV